jgi:oxygen-independent coproporphyrinogen-3 oxidase
VFVGGGTPTFTDPLSLRHLLGELPSADEVTVEANPETVTGALAELLAGCGVTRVSLGAQSFDPQLLDVLERRARPDDVRRSVAALRDAGLHDISLDLLYGVPGQTAEGLERDLDEAVALGVQHLSCYELEAKPGTRFTHAWAGELERQSAAMEGYFELVVDRLTANGFRWYETANFCRADGARDLRARHNLGYWHGDDYLGVGVGAVSTVGRERLRNTPSLGRYTGALERGEPPEREVERLDEATKRTERLMLGLRLDEPLALGLVADVVDHEALERLSRAGLVDRLDGPAIRLTRRGRFLGGAVTAELLAA